MRRRRVLALCGAAALPLTGCTDALGGSSRDDSQPDALPEAPVFEPLGDTPAAEAVSVGGDWSSYGRDVQTRGYSPGAGGPATDPAVAWRYDGRAPTLNSSPAIADGVVYVTPTGGPSVLAALEATTGEELWRTSTDGYVGGAPALDDDTAYVGTWRRAIHAIDRRNGETDWTVEADHRIGGGSATLAAGTLYVATRGEGPGMATGAPDDDDYDAPAVLALDPATGDERWRYDEFDARATMSAVPAVADGVVVGTCDGDVFALAADSGSLRWNRETGTDHQLAPTVADGHVFVGGHSEGTGAVTSLRLEDGRERWRTPIEATAVRTSLSVADETVYAAASRSVPCPGGWAGGCEPVAWGRLYAFDRVDGDIRWTADLRPDARSSPAVTRETVYVGNGDGLTAVARGDGDVRWTRSFEYHGEAERDPYVDSSPAVSGNLLVVGASDGVLRAITPAPE